jgi:hypothetical protein
MRVQLRINWNNGQVTGPWLQDARASENTGQACVEETALPKGALYLTDSGYLILKRMRADAANRGSSGSHPQQPI